MAKKKNNLLSKEEHESRSRFKKFTSFTPRDKPPKRRGVHKKSLSKGEKLQKKLKRYKGQGR